MREKNPVRLDLHLLEASLKAVLLLKAISEIHRLLAVRIICCPSTFL